MFQHGAKKINQALGIEDERWDELSNEVGDLLSENEGCVSKLIEGLSKLEATEIEKLGMTFMVGGFITDQISELKAKESLFKELIKGIQE